jgi:hypothetical protein
MGKSTDIIFTIVGGFLLLFGLFLIGYGLKVSYFSPYTETYAYVPSSPNLPALTTTVTHSGNTLEGGLIMGLGVITLVLGGILLVSYCYKFLIDFRINRRYPT